MGRPDLSPSPSSSHPTAASEKVILGKAERLAAFVERIKRESPVGTQEDARKLICRVLDEVEDEFSGIVANPDSAHTLKGDGRMYGPHENFRIALPAHPGLAVYRMVHHETLIAPNGAFTIRERITERILVASLGLNGKSIVDV